MMLIEVDQTAMFALIGQAVIIIILFIIFMSLFGTFLIMYSFITDRFLFPNLMLTIIILLEGVLKSIFRLIRLDDSIIDKTVIKLRNRVSLGQFKNTPTTKRVLFFPQCLRDIGCPSKLTPEGIQCVKCGRCEIGNAKEKAEELGYRVFIVPGSSFIKRMIKKYEPSAIIGVGCRFEVKNGLDLCSNIGLVGVGMELEKAGCLATELGWDDFYRFMDTMNN